MSEPGAAEPEQVAVEAYIYLYPLVTMEVTRRQVTNRETGQADGGAPMGQFAHIREFPDAAFREVVRPNFDTLYSSAWLDLSDGPVLVDVPDTHGRYYLLPMLDMWTDVFAVPGWRTTGTDAATYVLVAPGWSGTLPEGATRIEAPTPVVWIIGRTQTNGPADYDAVRAIQDGIAARPLTGQAAPFTPDPSVDMTTPPLLQVNALSGHDYFTLAAELLGKHPPHGTDHDVLARSRVIGLRPGRAFDPGRAAATAVESAPRRAQELIFGYRSRIGRPANGWVTSVDTIGVYGNHYLKRACIAMVGLGANPPEDAIYPLAVTDRDGATVTGDCRYRLHFEAGQTPPVDAFWSLTMYDSDGFQVANPIDRYAIGDRDDLQYGPDGSLDLYIQRDSPGPDRETNWLPSADGTLGLTMRLYAPRPQALDGTWNPPPLEPVG